MTNSVEFCFIEGKNRTKFSNIADLNAYSGANLKIKDGSVYTEDLSDRFFLKLVEGVCVLSRSLSDIASFHCLIHRGDSILFYKKYGFIYPPYTQYDDVYILVPYNYYNLTLNTIEIASANFNGIFHDEDNSLEEEIGIEIDKLTKPDNSILVSGGIDSSVLLSLCHERDKIVQAFMCKMSSLPEEGKVARYQCQKLGIDFDMIDMDKNLHERATEFVQFTGELISDPIAIVFPELMYTVKDRYLTHTLIDGQGADSLLNGLPHIKLFRLWDRTRYLRFVLKIFSCFIPQVRSKRSKVLRKLYRITKVINSLSYSRFSDCLLYSMRENPYGEISSLERLFIEDFENLSEQTNNDELSIRIMFMFRILPAREMQKYLLASKYDIDFVLPFMNKTIINKFLGLSNNKSVVKNVYKSPITTIAFEKWPEIFKKSNTSPFQVNYNLGGSDIKSLSLDFFKIK